MSRAGRLLSRLSRSFQALAAIGLMGITLLLLARPLVRHFGIQFHGIEALSQLLAVWIAFLMLGTVEIHERHIRIEYFYDKLPSRVQSQVDLMIGGVYLLVTLVAAISAVFAIQVLQGATLQPLGIPAAIVPVGPLIGFSFLTLVLLAKFAGVDFDVISRD